METANWARILYNQSYTDAIENELDALVYELGWIDGLLKFLRGLCDDIEFGKA